MNSLIQYIRNPFSIFAGCVAHTSCLWPDRFYLKIMFRNLMGYKLDLKNPKTFSEKLQWLKLYDRRPEYTMMVDKYAVKKYVSSIIGSEYVIPTLGVWDKPEDIEWDKLPDRFVLKCTHDSGTVIIVKDKANLDISATRKKLAKWLKRNYFLIWREWPYKNVPRRIIAEKYIEPTPNTNDLPDYKFFCFNGKVKAMFVATERQNPNEEVKFDFFNADFEHLPFRQGHDNARVMPTKPKNFDMMKQAAEKLSKGIPQVRVDFYEIGEKVLFGELTLFHFSGMMPFEPKCWDKKWGDMLTLPGVKLGGVIINKLGNNEIRIERADLPDYKFFCFNGIIRMLYIATGRHSKDGVAKFDFFDDDFAHLPFQQKGHPNAIIVPEKPRNFEKMKYLAEKLSQGLPHVRIDFYENGNQIYFGEMTFYSMSGLSSYDPVEWDYRIGDWLDLPNKK